MLTQFDPGAALGTPPIHSFTHQDDRICGIGYDFATPPQAPACNVSYDGAGNIVSMPTSVLVSRDRAARVPSTFSRTGR